MQFLQFLAALVLGALLNHVVAQNNDFTVEAWIYAHDLSADIQPILGQWKDDTGDLNSTFRLSVGYSRVEFCWSLNSRLNM